MVSCAKVSYIVEQGIGQISLEYNDIDNQDFLNDPKQNKEHKEKVKIVEKAKGYFFNYYNLKSYPIYDEVKILDQKAVSYLVIHSPKNEIKAMSTSFPFLGKFPYLGFFSEDSAIAYATDKKAEGYQIYMRSVYAYSTLNNPFWPFHDNILSSFFIYKKRELTELVFHELVHTIIFVGNNVGFNENLAQFIAREMMTEYFKYSATELKKIERRRDKSHQLNQLIVQHAQKLNQRYQSEKADFDTIGNDYLNKVFYPSMKKYCKDHTLTSCWPLKGEWNNARFAAFKTYEAKQNEIKKLYQQLNLPLKDFVLLLIKLEKDYDGKSNFITFVKNKVK